MVTCRQAVDLLGDFLEERLQPEIHSALKSHMTSCPPCEQFLESYRKTTSLCKKALLKDAPPELLDRLMNFLRQQNGK